MTDGINRQLHIACHMYLMLTYKDQFLATEINEFFNRMMSLLFDITYYD